MSEAHKTPCDDPSCPQFVCENRNAHLGGFSQAAHTELKDWDKETARLRAQIAALKAENEALKKVIDGKNKDLDTAAEMANLDIAALRRYTSWTPQDPGTKEAMECAEGLCAHKPANDRCIGNNPKGEALAHALRAAMVRLEEAEKRDEFHVSQCAALAEKEKYGETWRDNAQSALNLAARKDRELEAMDADRSGKIIGLQSRAEAAESQVVALTASLASVTKERDREIDALQEEAEAHKFTTEMYATQCKQSWKESLRSESAEASLAELRKRMGEAEKVIGLARSLANMLPNDYNTGKWTKAELEKVFTDFLASPPSPAEFRTDAETSGKKEPADASQRNRPACSPSASKSAPPSPAPVGRWDHCGHHDCDCEPAPVESKPCPHSTCTALAAERAKAAAEHDLYLTAHRQNMELATKNVEISRAVVALEKDLSLAREAFMSAMKKAGVQGLMRAKVFSLLAALSKEAA